MKKILVSVLSFLILFCIPSFALQADEPVISARSAAVLCVDNSQTVFLKNAHEKLPMASTTKIMTALLTVEQCCPERTVKVSREAVSVEGTSMGLSEGDIVDYRTLVCGMLLSSGNDAANVAAADIAGSNGAFASLMNERAKQLGMLDTSFVTPSGLDADGHFSTAYDMALLTKKAIENPSFRQICSSKSITVSFVSPKKQVTLYNHNKLLGTLDGVFGVKTGFTKKSGRCLVSACCRDGITLVCVTLNAKDDWKDHAKLYEYCFKRCQKADDDFTEVGVFVTGGDRKTVNVEAETVPVITDYEGRVERLVTVDRFLYAPVKTGQRVGRAYYYSSDGVLLLETDLISSEAVNAVRIKKQEKKKSIIDFIRDLFRR